MRFTIFSDHKTLEYIYGGKHKDGRRACSRAESWALRLQPYDFEVKHIPGSSNISDVLSRLCPPSELAFDEDSEHFLFAIGEEPLAVSLDEIRSETRVDETISSVIKALETQKWPKELFRYQAFADELGVIGNIVVRNDRIVLPQKLRAKALDIAHRGHPGIVAMRRNLRERVWWPCMDREISERVQECLGCAAVSHQFPPEPMLRKKMPQRAWQEIAIDFFSAKDCATFLVIVDYFSRYLKVIEMRNTTATKTIDELEAIFYEQTYPETIRCDNGPPFSSEQFLVYCKNKNIRLVKTIPYWPQMNGLVERQNRGILRALRIAKATNKDWRKALSEYVYSYNTTPHSVTEKAPHELMMGRPVKDLLPSLRTVPDLRYEGIREDDAMKKMAGKLYADKHRHAKHSEIAVGDTVMIRNYESGKLESNFRTDRFKVIEKTGSDTMVVNEEGVKYRRPITHLRKWPIQRKTSTDSITSLPEINKQLKPVTSTQSARTKCSSKQHHATESGRPMRKKKTPRRYSP